MQAAKMTNMALMSSLFCSHHLWKAMHHQPHLGFWQSVINVPSFTWHSPPSLFLPMGNCRNMKAWTSPYNKIFTSSAASSYPSGLSEGRRWILVLLIKVWMRGFPRRYSEHRYCARYISSSFPTTSFPCMLPMYLNSGLTVEHEVMRLIWLYLSGFQNQTNPSFLLMSQSFIYTNFIHTSLQIAQQFQVNFPLLNVSSATV